MRRILALALLLAVPFASLPSRAAPLDASNPCTLLDWHDLQSMGVTEDSHIESADWRQEATPAELSGGRLFTAMCAAVVKSPKGRTATMLNLSSVSGDVSEAQFLAWLEVVAAEPRREGEKGVKEFRIGDADCESGRDETVVPALYEDEQDTVVVEHFVACDRHVGRLHVSMNTQVSSGRKDELPDPEQVKALLDKSIARIAQTGFRTPR